MEIILSEFKFKTERKSGIHRRVRDGLEIKHNKNVYLCWYGYVQYLNYKNQLNEKIYNDWDISSYSIEETKRTKVSRVFLGGFDDWWEKMWKELFGEKETGFVECVTEINENEDKDTTIWIKVPLDTDSVVLRSKCKTIIDEEMKSRKIKTFKKTQTSKYKVDISKNFEYRVWIRRLSAIYLRDNGIKLLDIFDKLSKEKVSKRNLYEYQKKQDGFVDERQTKSTMVLRDIQLGKKLLENVKNGRFSTLVKKKK